GIEILARQAGIARLQHFFREQAIVAGNRDALAKALAGRARRALVADRPIAQALQSVKNIHPVTLREWPDHPKVFIAPPAAPSLPPARPRMWIAFRAFTPQ